MQARRARCPFRALAEASPEIAGLLGADRIAEAFDSAAQLAYVDTVFECVGLG